MSKVYELSLTSNYVTDWGTWDAVRELLQNAIDNPNPFTFEFIEEPEGTYMFKGTSKNTILPTNALLLGMSTKTTDDGKIGGFGEGFKLALLVLNRLDKAPLIINGFNTWRPELRKSEMFNATTLHIIEEDAGILGSDDLTVCIGNVTKDEIDLIRERCLQLQAPTYSRHSTEYGEVLLDAQHARKLFVNGLFICDIQTVFGYNIKPEHVKLERDRKTVDSWDLMWLVCKMWIATKRYDEIAEMIKDGVTELQGIQHQAPEAIKEACYKVFQEAYEKKIPVSTQEEVEELARKGFTETVVVSHTFKECVKESPSYRSSWVYAPVINSSKPVGILEKWLEKNRKGMHYKSVKSMRELIKAANKWRFL